jgi:hypothetical protein
LYEAAALGLARKKPAAQSGRFFRKLRLKNGYFAPQVFT